MPRIPSRIGNEIAQRFTLERETLKRQVKDNPADRIELEVGDIHSVDFQPQAKIKRWDNEVNFSLRRKKEWKNPSVSTAQGKVRFMDTDEEVHIYEKPEIGEDGGLEIELHLKTKPTTNRFEFSIETKGLNFFYQGELTQEEIDEGAERPENVVGSYAVYHKTGRNNKIGGKEYKTGKAFHIYRPHIVDADGNEEWGELEIDEETGILTVIVSQKFLAQAVYPVVIDPTFGYTSAGASQVTVSSQNVARRLGGPFTLSENGTLDDINIYLRMANLFSRNVDQTVFINTKDSDGAGIHDEVLSYEELDKLVSEADWYTFIASSQNIFAGELIISHVANDSDYTGPTEFINAYYDSGPGDVYFEIYSNPGAYLSSKEDPWNAMALTQIGLISIYATYTAVAEETSNTSIKQSGSFGSIIPKVKVSGSFQNAAMKVKVSGTFV